MGFQGFDLSDLALAIFIYVIVGVRSVNYDTNISTMVQMIDHKSKKVAFVCKFVCLFAWPFKNSLQKFLYWTVKKLDEQK
jgi:hypothetical protein